MSAEAEKVNLNQSEPKPGTPATSLVESEDYYVEGGLVVFTANYHLRRGYCCENGCRHCPYERQKPDC
jgi:2-iminoacetate synthase ThiH